MLLYRRRGFRNLFPKSLEPNQRAGRTGEYDGSFFSGLFGAICVYFLDLFYWKNRQKLKRINGNLDALRAEITYCGEIAKGFLDDTVQAPLYRLPHIAYGSALPVLNSEGAVGKDQVSAWLVFYQIVETLNRGLDLADERRIKENNDALAGEYGRNRAKAEKISYPDGGIYREAIEMTDRRCNWWNI